MKQAHLLIACYLASAPTPVLAQDVDVVVMRRVIAAPGRQAPTPAADPVASPTPGTSPTSTSTPVPTGIPAPSSTPVPSPSPTAPDAPQPVAAAEWTYGEWTFATAESCAPSAKQTRTATCAAAGAVAAPARCGPVGTLERLVTRTDGCGFRWIEGVWGEYTSGCTVAATRSRAVACSAFRPGSTDFQVEDAMCTASERPAEVDLPAVEVRTGCIHGFTYGEWGPPSSTCSSSAKSTRSATCHRYTSVYARADQPLGGDAVDPAECTAAGLTADAVKVEPIYTSCGDLIANGDFRSGLGPWTGSAAWFNAGQVRMWTIGGTMSQPITRLDVGSTYVLVGYLHNGSSTAATGDADITMTYADGSIDKRTVSASAGGAKRQITVTFTPLTPTATLGITNRNKSSGNALLTVSSSWSLNLVR